MSSRPGPERGGESGRLDDPDERLGLPLDAADPRYAGSDEAEFHHPRRLVPTGGPGSIPDRPAARRLRVLIPVAFSAAIVGVLLMLFVGLDPGSGREVLGDADLVRSLVAERPYRVCYRDSQPCAWLTVVDGEVIALETNGPMPEEYGRQGVGWCPSSRRFGANATGSVYDAAGQVVRGPAPRGLDRFATSTDDVGRLVVDFTGQTAGRQAARVTDVVPAAGPACDQVPFDRDPDLPAEARGDA